MGHLKKNYPQNMVIVKYRYFVDGLNPFLHQMYIIDESLYLVPGLRCLLGVCMTSLHRFWSS